MPIVGIVLLLLFVLWSRKIGEKNKQKGNFCKKPAPLLIPKPATEKQHLEGRRKYRLNERFEKSSYDRSTTILIVGYEHGSNSNNREWDNVYLVRKNAKWFIKYSVYPR